MALAAQAAAKEVVAATVCGATDCREIEDRGSLAALHEGGTPTAAPERASGWFRADLVVRTEDQQAQVSEVVLIDEPAGESADDGGAQLGWIAGGAGTLALGLLSYYSMRRRRSAMAPRPAEG